MKSWTTENVTRGKNLRQNKVIKACFEEDDNDGENFKQFPNNRLAIMLTRIDFIVLRNGSGPDTCHGLFFVLV
jgi:hypothetical protein